MKNIEQYIVNTSAISTLLVYDYIIGFGLYERAICVDTCISPFCNCNAEHIKYEVGTEEGVAALLLATLGAVACNDYANGVISEYVANLDFGYLESETMISEDELEALRNSCNNKKIALIIGGDLLTHDKAINILYHLQAIYGIDVFVWDFYAKNLCLLKKEISNLKCVENLPESNGCLIYIECNIAQSKVLRVSSEFAKIWKLANTKNNIGNIGDVIINFDGISFVANCIIDSELSGIIGILSLDSTFECGYRYKNAHIIPYDDSMGI